MEKILNNRLGMRTVKTGLSVSLGMLISQLLNLKSPVFVVIGAIMSMQSSVSESFIMGKNRMLATLVGAIVGLITSNILPQNAFFLGLGVILVIYIHNLFDWKKSISLSTIVFSVIFMNTSPGQLSYAVNRTLDTFVGILVSMLVNYFIASPNKESIFIQGLKDIYLDSKEIVYNLVRGKSIDIDEIKNTIMHSENEYEILKQDIDMNFYKTDSEGNLNKMILVLDDIYSNISTLSKLKTKPILTVENIKMMQELYNLGVFIPDFDHELEELDIVYNYILEDLFNDLLQIERFLGEEAHLTL